MFLLSLLSNYVARLWQKTIFYDHPDILWRVFRVQNIQDTIYNSYSLIRYKRNIFGLLDQCAYFLFTFYEKSVTYVKVLRVSQDFKVLPDFASLDPFLERFGRTDCEYLACFLLCFIVITGHYHLLLWWHQLVFMVRSSVFSCHQSWNTSPSPVFIAPFFSYPQKIRLSRVVQAGKVCSKVPLWWSGMQKRQLDPFILQKYEVVIVLLQLST